MFGNILGALVLALIGAALLFNGYRWFRVLLWVVLTAVGMGAQSATNKGSLAVDLPPEETQHLRSANA